MQHIGEIIGNQTGKQLAEASTTTTELQVFSDEERELTAYFFLRLSNIYLKKFTSCFPTDEAVDMCKRDYCKQIGTFTQDQLHAICEKLKRYIALKNPDYIWPDLNKILMLTPEIIESPCHRLINPEFALEDLTAKEARKAHGREQMRQLRERHNI